MCASVLVDIPLLFVSGLARACHASPSKPMRRAAHARERASSRCRLSSVARIAESGCYIGVSQTDRRTKAAKEGPHCNHTQKSMCFKARS